jgi:hypothetical protein
MFSNAYLVWLVRREINRDRVREAERYRLAQAARPARPRQRRLACRTLTWLGRQLVDWGLRLQERYAAWGDPSPLRVANRGR